MGRTWSVWGDDSSQPLDTDMTEEEARVLVDRLTAQGRDDVYAEDSDSGRTYEG